MDDKINCWLFIVSRCRLIKNFLKYRLMKWTKFKMYKTINSYFNVEMAWNLSIIGGMTLTVIRFFRFLWRIVIRFDISTCFLHDLPTQDLIYFTLVGQLCHQDLYQISLQLFLLLFNKSKLSITAMHFSVNHNFQ